MAQVDEVYRFTCNLPITVLSPFSTQRTISSNESLTRSNGDTMDGNEEEDGSSSIFQRERVVKGERKQLRLGLKLGLTYNWFSDSC